MDGYDAQGNAKKFSAGQINVRQDVLTIAIGTSLLTYTLSLALEWAILHQAQLKENWKRLRASQTANKIVPLK